MRIAITGATGFLGNGLTRFLHNKGHVVIALSRNPERAKSIFGERIEILRWLPDNDKELTRVLDGLDAIVNLAGENIGSSLWTRNKRENILESRMRTGKLVSQLVRLMRNPPRVLIQASAVGFYGERGEQVLTERSDPGTGFLPEVAVKWEKSTAAVGASGIRCIIIRSGVVLASHGGAFPKLALPYKLHIGTILGSGKQWVPWIHYEDEINAIYFLITNAASNGIYNLVAPVPTRMIDICDTMGRTIFNVPPSLLRLGLGKMAEEIMLISQRVMPERLIDEGFQFKFKDIEDAIKNIYKKEKSLQSP